mgnify:FL=1
MHRQGFYLDDLVKVLKVISHQSSDIGECLRGIYTHFASAKDITYPNYTLWQIKKFKEAKEIFRKAGYKNLIAHTSATGGALLYPQAHFDLVRIGIGLYGYFPTKETALEHSLVLRRKLNLEHVLSWRALVSEVKNLVAGDYIGYDLTEETRTKTKSGIIPIGYWHGFPRSLSSRGEVLVKGKRAKVLGRVSMDLIVVDLSNRSKVKVGDIATLIGRDGKEKISANDFGYDAHTISYEIITRLNPMIKRFVV